jgi:hypothetical protein
VRSVCVLDIGIDGLVRDFKDYIGVLAFGLGLVLGFSFDTTGPIVPAPREAAPVEEPSVAERTAPAPPREPPPD